MRVVIDPPVQGGQYLYQEECCYNRTRQWQVPARALHVATDLGADYIPPPRSWSDFRVAVNQYDEAWLIFTCPLQRFLDVPGDLRRRITAVVNPPTCKRSVANWGFSRLQTTADFGLDVNERFWALFDGAPATIQVNSGCPYRCQFCVWNRAIFRPRRWADPMLVAELSSRARNPYLICSQITGDHQWIETFVNARRCPEGPFATDLNCAHLPAYDRDIRRLAAAGMTRAVVGTEAFSDISLRRLGCPHTVAQSRLMFELLAELAVVGVYQLRRGFGESLEEIAETTKALLEIAETTEAHNAPHEIRVGPVYYWHESELSRTINTKRVAPIGFSVAVENMEPARLDAWNATYKTLRAAGWNVR